MLLNIDEISHALVYGDGRPFLIALIKIDDEYKNVNVKKLIQNLNLKLNTIEKIRKFIILDRELTYQNGMMTQTMKIKKKRYFHIIKNRLKNFTLIYNTLCTNQ